MSGTGRLLLVEDDPVLRDAVALVLRTRGWQVREAATGRDALDALEEDGATAVVVDLGLPDLSGPELVEALREPAPEARLVVFTGRDSPELRQACRDAGADEFLAKPVSGGELADLLADG